MNRMLTGHFSMVKQGEQDYACAITAIASAAQELCAHRFRKRKGDVVSAILENLDKRGQKASALCARALLGGDGCYPEDIGPLFESAHLRWEARRARSGMELSNALDAGPICMAFVLSRFKKGGAPAAGSLIRRRNPKDKSLCNHYVLVRRHGEQMFVGDPHPWHEDEYPVSASHLVASMTAGRKRTWIASLQAA